MARPTNKKNNAAQPARQPKEADASPWWGTFWLLIALLIAFALFSYSPAQDTSLTTAPENSNLLGRIGSSMAGFFYGQMGLTAWIFPMMFIWLSYMCFCQHLHRMNVWKALGWILVLLSALVLFGMIDPGQTPETITAKAAPAATESVYFKNGVGGALGRFLYGGLLRDSIGPFGAGFAVLLGFAGFVFLALKDNILASRHLRNTLDEWRRYRDEVRAQAEEMRLREQEEKAKEEASRTTTLPATKMPTANTDFAPKDAAPAPPEPAKAPEPPAPAPTLSSQAPLPVALPPSAQRQVADPDKDGPVNLPPPATKQQMRISLPPSARATAETPEQPTPTPTPTPAPAPLPQPATDAKPVEAAGQGKQTGIPAPTTKISLKLGTGATEEIPAGQPVKVFGSEPVQKAENSAPRIKGDWHFPNIDLLNPAPPPPPPEMMDDHQATADNLVRILSEFGVSVTVGEVHVGPVITRYDVHPAPGVRVERIVNLDKNIAMGLKAISVRVLAPVPGKGCVGVEVPNRKPQSVCLRDILESVDWVGSKAEIPLALGKDVSGRPLIADLARMPHMLIAGSTGSGKTVCINSIIASLLYRMSPDDIRFVMVDPKIVEMQVYNDLPHMLIPVVTEPKKVPQALKFLLHEMTNRYTIFAKLGVRNIGGFNARRAKDAEAARDAAEQERAIDASMTPEERTAINSLEVPRDPDVEIPEKLPYIVCVVDELADLMMVAPADIETCIARLAQLARAAGIHLVLATQRPSVNVITGVIKANLPSRIAFKVASKVDSRVILDQLGADQLIGRGDMLFLGPGTADLLRSQGAFTSDEEIAAIVAYVKEHNPPVEYDPHFKAHMETDEDAEGEGGEGGQDGDNEWGDDMVPDAIEVLRATRRASTSMLQRRLKIGYNRAARIMEILEERGIVGPENGAQPREILKDLDSLDI